MWPARGVNHNHIDTLHVGYRHSEQSIEKKSRALTASGTAGRQTSATGILCKAISPLVMPAEAE